MKTLRVSAALFCLSCVSGRAGRAGAALSAKLLQSAVYDRLGRAVHCHINVSSES